MTGWRFDAVERGVVCRGGVWCVWNIGGAIGDGSGCVAQLIEWCIDLFSLYYVHLLCVVIRRNKLCQA